MKAYTQFNRRKLVHEWRPTAVARYFQAKCSGMQEHISDLMHQEHQVTGKPLCKRCFPLQQRPNPTIADKP